MAKHDTKYQRWTNRSKAHSHLNEMFLTGEVDPTTMPKDLYDLHPVFQEFPLNSFRSAFNKMKNQYGINVRKVEESKYS